MAIGTILSNWAAGPVGGFLWKHKGTIALLLAVISLMGYVMYLQNEADEWQKVAIKHESTIKQLKTKAKAAQELNDRTVRDLEASVTSLTASVSGQNETINTLNQLLNRKNQEIAELKRQREEQQKKHQQELERILKEPRPKDCQSSIEYLIKGKENLSW